MPRLSTPSTSASASASESVSAPPTPPSPSTPSSDAAPAAHSARKRGGGLVDLLFSLIIPTIILMKFSSPEALGPVKALLTAVAFPLGFGIYEIVTGKKTSALTYIGLANVALTGGLGLFKLNGHWFALKEASIPLLFCLICLLSLRRSKTLTEYLLINDMIWNKSVIFSALEQRDQLGAFRKLMKHCTLWLAVSFLLSTLLNYILAMVVLKSPGGTPEFNEELAYMQLLSFPVISLPCSVLIVFVILKLFRSLPQLTGLSVNELLRSPHPSSSAQDSTSSTLPLSDSPKTPNAPVPGGLNVKNQPKCDT